MNKKTIRIAGWALGLSMAVAGIGVAVGAAQKAPIETKADYASATTVSISKGTGSVYDATVNSKSAIKVGKSSGSGNVTISVPTNTSTLYIHAAGWSGKSVKLSLATTSGSFTSSTQSIASDSNVSGSSTDYTISTESSYLYSFSMTGVTSDSTVTITTAGDSGDYRFVIWDAAYELGSSDPTISLSSSSMSLNGTESKNVNVAFSALTENISVSQTSSDGGEVTIASSISKSESSPYSFAVTGKSAGTVTVTFASAGATSQTLNVTVTDWTYSDLELSVDEEDFVGEYYVGDSQNLAGITVTLVESSTYPGGTRETDVTASSTFNFNSSTTGTKQLIATYSGHSTDDKIYYRVSEAPEADILFGSASGSLNINGASVNGDDANGKTWTVTTAGTTSFTPNASYAQIGSSSKPATSITFSATIADSAVNVSSFSAKFGGFSGTAGTITLKVGETTVGTGSLSATSDVVVSNNKKASGTTLTVTVTGISKGVKAYYISYEAKTDKQVVEAFVEDYMHLDDYDTKLDDTEGDGSCVGYYVLAKSAFKALSAEQKSVFLEDSDFTDAKNRLAAWATANKETFNTTTGVFSAATVNQIQTSSTSDSNLPLVITVIAGTMVAAGGFYLIQRKRRNED